MANWFYAANGQQHGPHPEAEFVELIGNGTIRSDTLVWTEGMAGWQQARSISELAPALREGSARVVELANAKALAETTRREETKRRAEQLTVEDPLMNSGSRVENRQSAEKRFPLKPILSIKAIPNQDVRKAIGFRSTGAGPLDLLQDPFTDPYDPEQAELYARIRAQLNKLKEDTPSQERNQISDVVDDFLSQPPFLHEVKFKKVLWLCGNALRSALAKHDAVSKDEFHYSRLPPSVAEALRRPVQEWNVFVFGDDKLRELDDRRFGPQEREVIVASIEAAKPLVEKATGDRNITTEQAAKVVAAGIESADVGSTDINAKQAQDVLNGTLKNLATQIVRRAHLFCSKLIEPRTDEEKAVQLEYQKGAAKALGAATIAGVIGGTTIIGGVATPYAISFFEFVAANATLLKEYFLVVFQGEQITQIIDTIAYTRKAMYERAKEMVDEKVL